MGRGRPRTGKKPPLGKWVETYCAQKNITLAEFAARVHVSPAAVNDWTSPTKAAVPRGSRVGDFAVALKLSADARQELAEVVAAQEQARQAALKFAADMHPSIRRLAKAIEGIDPTLADDLRSQGRKSDEDPGMDDALRALAEIIREREGTTNATPEQQETPNTSTKNLQQLARKKRPK